MVFEIPSKKINKVFPLLNTKPPTTLAYIKWFSPILATPEPKHLMYKVSRSMQGGQQSPSVIPVDSIVSSVHLFPQFGPTLLHDWNSFTVLEKCTTFYINPLTNANSYMLFR